MRSMRRCSCNAWPSAGFTPRAGESDAFTELERLALDLAVAMTQTPSDVSEELFQSLQHHVSPPQLVELVPAIAQENFRAAQSRSVLGRGYPMSADPRHPRRLATGP
jgi:hypothetical protein